MAESINSFLELDVDNSTLFIENYSTCLDIDVASLKAEALVMKNVINAQGSSLSTAAANSSSSTTTTENPLSA